MTNKDIQKFKEFMQKWNYSNFDDFEENYKRLNQPRGKNVHDLEIQNEAMKETIAIILSQKKTTSKLYRDLQKHIIEFIEELAWHDVQYDAFQSTMGDVTGSYSAVPRYAKKYFDLWKEMFKEDLKLEKGEE